MSNLTTFIRFWFKFICAHFPTRLPIGMAEFDSWAKDVLALTSLPDNDSTRFALASTVPHQKAESFLVPKIKFSRLLEKSAANQVAVNIMHELKEKQQAAIKAEQEALAAKQSEATAQSAQVASSEQSPQG